jgi:hypothetical protein
MTERDYLLFFLWALAFMIAIGGMIQQMWPGLIQFVERRFLQARRPDDADTSHPAAHH